MAVNVARVQLLVDALRSDEFKQGYHALAHIEENGETTYCCLGVACEVAQRNGLSLEVARNEDEHVVEYNGTSSVLPKSVRDWYGFQTDNPWLEPTVPVSVYQNWDQKRMLPAAELNDKCRLPFAIIADAFEKTYIEGRYVSATGRHNFRRLLCGVFGHRPDADKDGYLQCSRCFQALDRQGNPLGYRVK